MNVLDHYIEIKYYGGGIKELKDWLERTSSLSTKYNRLTQIRSFLKNNDLEEELENFPIPEDLNQKFKKSREEYLVSRMKKRIPIYFSKEDYENISKKFIESYKINNNIIDLCILLGINCGRRLEEINQGKYLKQDNNRIVLLNPLKKKGKRSPISFPLLFLESNEFMDLLEIYQKTPQKAQRILYRVSKVFKPIDNGFNFHTFRGLYGFYSHEIYCQEKEYDPLLWLSDVLGHEKSNFTSTIHYSKYYKDNTETNFSDKINLNTIEKRKYKGREDKIKVDNLFKKISKEDLIRFKENYMDNKHIETNFKKEPAYIKLIDAILENMEGKELVLNQESFFKDCHTIYKNTYGVSNNGISIRQLLKDIWEINEEGENANPI